MRVFFIMVALLGLVLLVTVPAGAIQADFSGEYRVEGIYNDNTDMREDSTSNAFGQMRLRLKAIFKVTDKLSLTTRLDGLEKRWGDTDTSVSESTTVALLNATDGSIAGYKTVTTTSDSGQDDNIDMDHAYITAKTGLGAFLIGRQSGNSWGLPFGESEGPRDRITYILPIDNTIIAAVYEKYKELDGDDTSESNADLDKYFLTVTRKAETFKFGLLYGYYDYKTFQDMAQARDTATATSLANAAGYDLTSYLTNVAYANAVGNPALIVDNGALYAQLLAAGVNPVNLSTVEAHAHVFVPYFSGQFGAWGIKTELDYVMGEAKYDSVNNAGTTSKDARPWAFNLEVTYDQGPWSCQVGYASFTGDADYTDDEVNSFGYIESGDDWEKLAILTGTSFGLEDKLGKYSAAGGVEAYLGNLAGGGRACYDGYRMFYAGTNFMAREDITIGLVLGVSQADDTADGWDDNHGMEYDFTIEWRLLDNLTYNFMYAYLDAGDYWKAGDDTVDLKDTYLLWHRLTLEF